MKTANLPRYQQGYEGASNGTRNGKTRQGYWYFWHEGHKVALTKWGAPQAKPQNPNQAAKAQGVAVQARDAYLESLTAPQALPMAPVASPIEEKPACQVQAPQAFTVAQAVDYYLKNSPMKDRTRKFAEPRLELVKKELGHHPAEALKWHQVLDWINSHKGWEAAETRRKMGNMVKAPITFCCDCGLIETNPLQGKSVEAGQGRGEEAVWTPEELAAILEHASPEARLLFRAMADTGMRPSEAADLQASHIAKSDMGTIWTMPTSKNGKVRTIPLTKEWEKWSQDRPAGYLFTTPQGKQWTTGSWVNALHGARRKAREAGHQIREEISLYGLRHTYITGQVRKGVDVNLLAKAVGNSVAVLTKTYSHLTAADIVNLNKAG